MIVKINRKTFIFFLSKISETQLYDIEKNKLKENILTIDKIETMITQAEKKTNKKNINKKNINSRYVKTTDELFDKHKNMKTNAKRKYNYEEEKDIIENGFKYSNANHINTNSIQIRIKQNAMNKNTINKLANTLNDRLINALTTIMICIYNENIKNKILGNHNNINIDESMIIKQDFLVKDLILNIYTKAFCENTHIFNRKELIQIIHDFSENSYIDKHYKEFIIGILLKSLKLCSFFERMSINYQKSKYNVFNQYDLLINPIDNLNNRKKFILYQDNRKYVFNNVNLMKYIDKKLLYQEHYRCIPCKITNPYTNVEFNEIELYKLYFNCLDNYINIPLSFTLLFKNFMDYGKLLTNHNVYLQTAGIKNELHNLRDSSKLYYFNEIINNIEFEDIIDVDFLNLLSKHYMTNKDKIQFLKDEIEQYVLYNYSINMCVVDEMLIKIRSGLIRKKIYLSRI